MTVVLLVALILLVLINGFFVAAEFALVRTRRGKIEQLVEEGESGAEAVVAPARPDRRVALGLPGRDHDGLDRHRVPRRAGAREPDRAGSSAGSRTASPSVIAFAIAFTLVTALHISVGEQVPKMLAISRAERDRAPRRPPAQLVPRGDRPVDPRR